MIFFKHINIQNLKIGKTINFQNRSIVHTLESVAAFLYFVVQILATPVSPEANFGERLSKKKTILHHKIVVHFYK